MAELLGATLIGSWLLFLGSVAIVAVRFVDWMERHRWENVDEY